MLALSPLEAPMDPAAALDRVAHLIDRSLGSSRKAEAFRTAADALRDAGADEVRRLHEARRLTSLPEVGGAAAYYFDDFAPATMQQTLAAGLAQHSPARAAAARAQAGQFSWQQAAAGYLAVYQELLGR